MSLLAFNNQEWSAPEYGVNVKFNSNVWLLVTDYQSNHEMLFSLLDEQDGSSFALGINTQIESGTRKFDYEYSEAEYFSRLFNSDNNAKRDFAFDLIVDNTHFYCVLYTFENKIFGLQKVVRGLYFENGQINSIGMSWPNELGCGESNLPLKFDLLLQTIRLELNPNTA